MNQRNKKGIRFEWFKFKAVLLRMLKRASQGRSNLAKKVNMRLFIGQCRQQRFTAAKRFGQQHLNVSNVSFGKPPLTITQVLFPHANEGFRETHGAHLIEINEKILTPRPQCSGVMGCDVFQVKQL